MARYACTDLHGMYELWKQIKEYCKADDEIYFLGDAADRGPDGIKIIKELLTDRRVTYLMGNHEEFLIETGSRIIDSGYCYDSLWSMNGGDATSKAFCKLDSYSQEWMIRRLVQLPIEAVVQSQGKTIHLSHAGTSLWEESDERRDKLLWDRHHTILPWNSKPQYQDWISIHGHTPVQVLAKKYRVAVPANYNTDSPDIICYCDGHKYDLDLGSFVSNKVALFNLDTLEVEKYFTTQEEHQCETK